MINIKEEVDPEKELILQKIRENIKNALKKHFKKAVVKVQKKKEKSSEPTEAAKLKDHATQMVNITESAQGQGPTVTDYKE